ncbi:glycerate kinase [Patulibacter sp. SYSU D01012]|uniref:glycerate kinase n=1 Tax=Patulibacter sp. SYSU D01012 TaxID=2817381 RepID=UPI001B30C507
MPVAPTVLCAPDKLRGALDAAGAAGALAAGVRDAGGAPVALPVADGGEGTLDAVLAGGGARAVAVAARDAHGRPGQGRIADLGDGTVLVEAAEAIALAAIPADARDVGVATSAGVGDLVRAALDRGARRILVAVGGTATLDGGAGFLRALGADAPADGAGLLAAPRIDRAGLDPRLRAVALELLFDVDAPLCGPAGAAHRFGPQKGARPEELGVYDTALARWAAALGVDPALPGSGAAGGLGLALRALGARARPGAEAVLDLAGFDAAARGAALCLTAEGSVDASTLQGKTVDAVVRRCAALGVPVVAVGGRVEPGAAAALRARGAADVVALGPPDRPLAAALAGAAADLRRAARAATARAAA